MTANALVIRPCQGFDELAACVQLQMDVWGYGDRDVVPRRVFVVSQAIGGQVIGAFDGDLLVGFVMALPGISDGKPYLHSHMLAVNPDYRNQGIGRRLKLFQREEALGRGIPRMEWTFDPLEIKNSFLNLNKLGAIARRYTPNFYGISPSPLHGQIPTDRLYAEWWLDSDRVRARLDPVGQQGDTQADAPIVEQEVVLPREISTWRHHPEERERVLDIQRQNREHFERAFRRNLALVGFRMDEHGNGVFQLGPWHEP
jgi:predicted GNAT superfamily acetyltransferase